MWYKRVHKHKNLISNVAYDFILSKPLINEVDEYMTCKAKKEPCLIDIFLGPKLVIYSSTYDHIDTIVRWPRKTRSNFLGAIHISADAKIGNF